MTASGGGHTETVKLLLERGATVDLSNDVSKIVIQSHHHVSHTQMVTCYDSCKYFDASVNVSFFNLSFL